MCTCVVSLSCVMRFAAGIFIVIVIIIIIFGLCLCVVAYLHVLLANYTFVNLARRCAKLYVLRCVIIQQV